MSTPTQVCVLSCPNFSAPADRPFRMSTPVFVDAEISTQADGAQSSRVPVPLLEDPYEAIRQAYLDGTDTESEPIEDPVETETTESPLTVAPHTSLPESTLPTLAPILCRTARMAVRVPPAMLSGLSASMTEVAAMFESTFRKRFRSSYESSLSSSPPDLPLQKRYRGTSELVEDSEEDDDEEIGESLDSDSVSEDAKDGPDIDDESHGMDDESHGMDDESHGLDDESRGLDDEGYSVESNGFGLEEEKEAIPRRIMYTIRLRSDNTPLSPEWTSGSLPISPSPSIVPSPVSSPMISLTIPSPVATPVTAETEGFLIDLGAQVEMQEGLIRDHAVRMEKLSLSLFERSLEYEQERVTGENHDLRLQLAEERCARLELAEVVDSMRRWQEPRGDA
ncbi:hypothetical protein Tco_1456631 [Tanacetum coccineum]